MNSELGRFAGLVVILATATGAQAAEEPVRVYGAQNDATGHVYEIYSSPGISWDVARGFAESRSLVVGSGDDAQVIFGHLATITSAAEDEFIEIDLRQMTLLNEVWVGGVQEPDSSNPGAGWSWSNGEGDISTPQNPLPSYSNWLTNTSCNQAFEPNDCGSANGMESNKENHLAIGLNDRFGWNDEGALSNIQGFVVEYDLPRSAACTLEPEDPEYGTCKTIEGQTLVFPGNVEGKQIGFGAYEFRDPRVDANGNCHQRQLRLFADPSDPDADSYDDIPDNTLVIPPYLCGSPKFVAVRVNAEQLSITGGTVQVENYTDIVLPDNQYADGGKSICEDPIFQEPYDDGDPQYQDVVVWQSTNPTKMRELKTGVAGVGQFAGAAGEFTDGCGSSRGKTLGASYFVVGMHINFGPGSAWKLNPDANHERFIALTRYKLELLRDSIKESRSSGALLKNGDFSKMDSMVVNAIKFLDSGDHAGALDKVDNFVKFITPALYDQTGKFPNYEGEHISRASNIAFTLRVKVIPYD